MSTNRTVYRVTSVNDQHRILFRVESDDPARPEWWIAARDTETGQREEIQIANRRLARVALYEPIITDDMTGMAYADELIAA